MRILGEHFVVKGPKITHCCFCDQPINHIKKEELGKVFLCKCSASFIWPKDHHEIDYINNQLLELLR